MSKPISGESAPTQFKYIGKPRGTIDAPEKLKGQARYTADLQLPGMLHLRPVLSPHAHARIVSIDKEAALNIHGVRAVLDAKDLTHWRKKAASRVGALLARDEVMFQGHPVVVVVGETPQAAWDGASAVDVDYEEMDVVPDIATALRPGAPLVWPDGIPRDESDVSADHGAEKKGDSDSDILPPNVHSMDSYTRGDVEEGFAAADVVLERDYRTGIVHQGYMEPQVCLASPDPMGIMTIYTSTQGPRSVHNDVSRLLDLPHTQIKVVPMVIGGGFGGKHGILEPLAVAVALQMRAPVKLELTRTEDFMTTMPAPAAEVWLKMGVKHDGSICAIQARIDVDNGVFAAASWSGLLAQLLASGYRAPHLRLDCREVVTHKPMAGPYRAPTAQTASFAMESHMDELARSLKLDPLEFRLQNAAGSGDLMSNGNPWPSLGLKECLNALKESELWKNRQTNENEGWGIAVGLWPCGVSPASAVCRMLPNGNVQIQVGSVDISGINSGFVQIVAEVLSIDPSKVEIIQVDSHTGPVAPPSGGSQVSYSLAGAISGATRNIKDQLAKLATEHFEAAEQDLVFEDGSVHVTGLPSKAISLAQLAKQAESRKGGAGPVIATSSNSIQENAPAVAVHAVKVEVDRETGKVSPKNYIAVQDVGFAINPMLIEGQVQGGVLQGLGWGLWEEMPYDAQGQLLASNFLDYAMPRADDSVFVDAVLVENPSPLGPLGIRGVGEPPIVPGGAAVANAVREVTGVRFEQLPIKPQNLWKAMNS